MFSTLPEYCREEFIPRGLRLKALGLFNYDQWSAISNKCSNKDAASQ